MTEKYRYAVFCVLAGFVAFSTQISHSIVDSLYLFHEGEYVGLLWNMRSYLNGQVAFPLLIHGCMDYLPSMIAQYIYGDDRIIVGTRAINTVIVWVCWVLFLDICYQLTSKSNQRLFWMSVATILFLIISPKLNTQALMVQEAFINVRDLFLVITVWCFAMSVRSGGGVQDHTLFIGND